MKRFLLLIAAILIACALAAATPAEKAHADGTVGNWTIYYGSDADHVSQANFTDIYWVSYYLNSSSYKYVKVVCNETGSYDAGRYADLWRLPNNSPTRVLTCKPGVTATYWSGHSGLSMLNIYTGTTLAIGEGVTISHTNGQHAVYCEGRSTVWLAGSLRSSGSYDMKGVNAKTHVYRNTASSIRTHVGELEIEYVYRVMATAGSNVKSVTCSGYFDLPYREFGQFWYRSASYAPITATTISENYYVSGWSKGSGANEYTISRHMTLDYGVTINASLKSYYVSYFDGSAQVAKPTYNCGTTYYYPSESTYAALRKTGYTLDGWTDSSAAQTKKWNPGAAFHNLSTTNGETVSRFAVWRANAYTVRFDGNGADGGAMADQRHVYDTEQNLSKLGYTRQGWKFLGWSTSKTATTATYTDEQTVKNLATVANATITLYAVWERSDFAFNTPDPVTANDLTASVTYDPASPAAYGSTVTARVRLQGTPRSGGVHLVSLKSDSLGLDQEIAVPAVRGSAVNEERVYTFTVPDRDTDDVQLGNSVAPLPDLYNQTFTYDGAPKPYLISSSIEGIELEEVLYAKIGSTEPPTTDAPVDVGSHDVSITLRMREGGAPVRIGKQLTIRPKALAWNVERLTAFDKEYDGSLEAAMEGEVAVDGVAAVDAGLVALADADVSRGEFLSAACGVDKPVTPDASAAVLEGERAANYALPSAAPPALHADITGLAPGIVLGRAVDTVFNGSPQRAVTADASPLVTFTDPSATSVVLNGAHEERVTYVYYVDPGCLQKTTSAVGATDIGGPPAFAGTYYVKAVFTPGVGQEQYNQVESGAVPFSIAPKSTGLAAVWHDPLVASGGLVYTGAPLTPQVDALDGLATTLVEGFDYDVAFSDNVNVGRARAHVTFKGNYEGSADLSFTVRQAVYSEDALRATLPTAVDEAYDGLPHVVECDPYLLLRIDTALGAVYRYTGVDGTAYDSSDPPVDVGTYRVEATVTTGNANYRFPPSDGGTDSSYVLKARLAVAYETNAITFKLAGGTVGGSPDDVVWPDAHRFTPLKSNHGGVPAPVRPGYELSGWESDGAVYAPARVGEEEVRDDRAYTAVWQPASVGVTFDGNGGAFKGGETAKTYLQPYLSSLDFAKITQPAREGSVFHGWAETPEKAAAHDVVWKPGNLVGTFTFDAPVGKTYYASWESAVHTITLYYNGGTVNTGGPDPERSRVFAVPHGEALGANGRAIDEPVLADRVFKGWNDANVQNFIPISTAELKARPAVLGATYVAVWDGASVTTTFRGFDDSGREVSYSVPVVTTSASPIAHPVVRPAEGETFRAWRVSESTDAHFPVGSEHSDADLFDNPYPLAGNVTFEAAYDTAQHDVTFELNGGTRLSGELSQRVPHGGSPSEVAVERAGHVLEGWLDVGGNVLVRPGDLSAAPIEADTVYLAQWTRDMKAVTFDANGGASTRVLDVQKGSTVNVGTVAAPRRAGFAFAGWASTKALADRGIADVTDSGNLERTVTDDTTFWAAWSNVTHEVTFQDSAGGVIETRAVPFNGSIGATFPYEPDAPPLDGKTFAGWSIATSGSVAVLLWASIVADVPTGDRVFTAAYADIEHTLSFSVVPGTGGPSAPLARTWGTPLSLADVAAPAAPMGYSFAGWYEGPGEGAARMDAFDFKRDATAYARYSGEDVVYTVRHYAEALDGTWEEVASDGMLGPVGSDPAAVERALAGFAFDAGRTTYETSAHPSPTASMLPLAADGSLVVKLYYARSTVSASFSTVGDVPVNEPTYRKRIDARFDERVGLPDDLACEGYTFGGWVPQTVYPPEFDPATRTFLMPADPVAFLGIWSANDYFVRYDLAGGQGAFADTNPYHKGQRATVLAGEPVRPGCAFAGWSDGRGGVYREGDTVAVDAADVTLTALWDDAVFLLTFDAGAAPCPAPPALTGFAGDEVVLPVALEWEGRAFAGWEQASDGAVLGAGSPYTVPPADEAFTAQWLVQGYRVTYELAGGTGDIRDEATHHAGDEVAVTASRPDRPGYTFEGWTLDGAPVADSFAMPASDATLVALWRPVGGGARVRSGRRNRSERRAGPRSVQTDEEVVLPDEEPVLDTYVFMGWVNGKGDIRQPGESYVVPAMEANGQATLTALWSQSEEYGVSYDLTGGSGDIRDERRYRAGAAVTVSDEVPVLDGMRFGGWRCLADGRVYGSGEQLTMPSEDVELVAEWKVDAVFTTAFLGNGGEPAVQTLSGTAGTVAPCPPAPERYGYAFTGWLSGDGSLYQPGQDIVQAEGDLTLAALWQGLDSTVRFDAAGGVPAPDDVTAPFGSAVAMPAAPVLEGMVFAGWSDGEGVYAAGASYPLRSLDVTLAAGWAAEGYAISYDLAGGAFRESAPAHYAHGDSFEFPTPEREDATFAGWFVDGDPARPKSGIAPEDTQDFDLVAVWEMGTHALTADVPAFSAAVAGTWPPAQPVVLTNTGSLDTSVLSVTSSSDAFVVSGSGPEVPVGGSIDTWKLRPASNLPAGDYTAEITVTYRDVDGAAAQVAGTTSFTVTPAPSVPDPPKPDPPVPPVPEPSPTPTPSGGGTVTEYVYLSDGAVAPEPVEPAPPAPEPAAKEPAEAADRSRTLAFDLADGAMVLVEEAGGALGATFTPASWDFLGLPLGGWEFSDLVVDGEPVQPDERGVYALPATGDHTLAVTFTRTGLNAFLNTWWAVALVFFAAGGALYALVVSLIARLRREPREKHAPSH